MSDPILDRLATAHRAVLAAGQAHLDGDYERLLDELDHAMDAAVAVAASVRSLESEPERL